MAPEYKWKAAARVKGDPQVVGECFERIREEAGELTARVVVEAAADESSPLHPLFEWDDAAAAEKHREFQAYHLLRSIVVRVERPNNEQREVRAFIVVKVDEESETQSYEALDVVMQQEHLRRQALQRAWREVEQWRDRYEDYEELAGVFAAIENQRSVVAAAVA